MPSSPPPCRDVGSDGVGVGEGRREAAHVPREGRGRTYLEEDQRQGARGEGVRRGTQRKLVCLHRRAEWRCRPTWCIQAHKYTVFICLNLYF